MLEPRTVRYGLATFAVLFLCFGLAGYLWLPGFAKAKLEALLSEEFARPVRVQAVEVSPYALSVTVRGFSIGQKNGAGEPLLAFDSLHVNLSSLTLARGFPVVSEVRLTGPKVAMVRQADGRFNFSDLIDKWTAPAPKPAPKAKPEAPLQFSVADIVIEGGAITFDDQLEQARHEVTELSLAVPFVTNARGGVDSTVDPKFSAKVDGAPLALAGSARPFAPGQDAAITLSINDFDLMRLVEYLPPDLPAKLQSARLDADLTIAFAKPQGKDAQVKLSGKTTLRNLALASARQAGPKGGAVVKLGRADLALDEATLAGAVRAGLALADFSVARGGTTPPTGPMLGFAGLEVKGVSLSTTRREASVAEVLLKNPSANLRRLAGGDIDALALADDFASPAGAKAAPKPTPKAEKADTSKAKDQPKDQAKATAPAKGPAPWKWEVARVAMEGGGLTFTDETLGRKSGRGSAAARAGRSLTARDMSLKVEGLASAPQVGPKADSKLDFSAKVNEQGSVGIKGGFGLAPTAADLDIDLAHVDLVALQSWVTGGLGAVLTRGEVSAKGRLKLAGEDAAFKGELALIDLNVLDRINATDLLRWRSLRLTGLDAGSAPPRLAVDDISLANFYARVLLTPEGRLNLQDVVDKDAGHRPREGAQAKAPAAQEEKPAPAPKPEQAKAPEPTEKATDKTTATAKPEKPGPPPQVRIGRINLSGGTVIFTDRFIKPNYTANLTDLSGRVGAIKAGTRTEVALRGKVDRTGPLDISGAMDPLGKPMSLDIKAKATGIEMSGFSPYSGRYVGYAIEKGKLSVDVHYTVDKGALKAENKIFLDQLTFGKKVDHPDAMNVPVNLLVALLSNSRGEIDINLPIEGSLDDPQFSVGGIIVKVLWNIIVKAATSPFSLLASLFSGGGEELSYLPFEPGRTELGPDQTKRLETIAKALRDRPALKLELAGHADPAAELEGLKKAALDRRIKTLKATDLARQGKAAGRTDEVTVSAEEYPRYLERVYKASDFKKPRNLIGFAKGLPPEEMEALILANAKVGPDDLARLAQDRAIAAQAWLVEKGGVDQARVFLLAPRVDAEQPKGLDKDSPKAPAGRVDFSLR